MKKAMIVLAALSTLIEAAKWNVQRDPFAVSDRYIQKTGKYYLTPTSTNRQADIKVKGIMYKDGIHKALLDIQEKGLLYVCEGESVYVDTSDIKTSIKVIKIEHGYVLLSINNGGAVRYDI
ncbi:MAG: hypothetical protein JXQ77_06020 [Campylobacterales bacterium]|nr:hypothetical protein [Campylobacterales bacterium]